MLKEIRKKQGMSVKELADAVGVSVRYLFFIENGERIPSLPVALKICSILNCKVEKIFATKSTKCTLGVKGSTERR